MTKIVVQLMADVPLFCGSMPDGREESLRVLSSFLRDPHGVIQLTGADNTVVLLPRQGIAQITVYP